MFNIFKKKRAPEQYITPSGAIYPLFADMLTQSHLLIGGATGSGKSTLVNGLMHTALYSSPATKRFILIDCKGFELSDYAALPHTIAHVTDPTAAIRALRYAIEIMEERFKAMSNMQGCKCYQGSDIYIVIDEFADLMTTNAREVTPLIQRISQLGRAARIHLILCTQCPLSEIIPTKIKANFDCRIALRTATAQDSRNIIDTKGAESLPNPKTAHKAEAIYKHDSELERYNIPKIDDQSRYQIINYWYSPISRAV
jgi:S-DNA-T family DNA segregation ATPase FtsK/SpoIIIE